MTRRKPPKWANMPAIQRKHKEYALRILDSATADVTATANQVLIKAEERIRDPSNFCTSVTAKDMGGYTDDPPSESARQWCATGAYLAELSYDPGDGCNFRDAVPKRNEVEDVIRAATLCASDFVNPALINDQLGHQGAIAMLDRARDALN